MNETINILYYLLKNPDSPMHCIVDGIGRSDTGVRYRMACLCELKQVVRSGRCGKEYRYSLSPAAKTHWEEVFKES